MQKLHPKAVWLFFFKFLFGGLVFILFFGIWFVSFFSALISALMGVKDQNIEGVGTVFFSVYLIVSIFFLVLYIVFCWIWAKLSYRYYGYELTNDALKKECGVIWKKYISIPYERIQNVDIYRGVFARILGLSDLQIQTAGYSTSYGGRGVRGAGAEGRLPGLDAKIAEQLREEFIKRAKGAKAGL
ncbi:PH domain-containing protein [Patescibacteria group bacterium]|nr:PH domain-containing protein [Patescibacteria group bacterium]MBU4367411.1 PH domain-containing protein [Patescibacteria group bacterium]MBU4461731.1 PH domain-containing protein [Patescibacteria group bacterium]MCG2700115.1 PH domain-containing protein [Candidatus Parcubacteria bacterium]